ncbi:unnamed protein product [Ectocarpus sp. 12 AP-2014]
MCLCVSRFPPRVTWVVVMARLEVAVYFIREHGTVNIALVPVLHVLPLNSASSMRQMWCFILIIRVACFHISDKTIPPVLVLLLFVERKPARGGYSFRWLQSPHPGFAS